MKFLIVQPSPIPILIPLGPKYSPQDPFFQILLACIPPLKLDTMFHNHIAQLAILLFYWTK